MWVSRAAVTPPTPPGPKGSNGNGCAGCPALRKRKAASFALFYLVGELAKPFRPECAFHPAGCAPCPIGPSNTLPLPLLGCFQAFQRNAVVRHKRSFATKRQEGPYNSFLTSFAADILLTSKRTALPDGGSGGFNPPVGSKGRSPLYPPLSSTCRRPPSSAN